MPRLPALALLALVLATYAPGVANEFLYDDHEVILAQVAPRSLADVAQLFAEPHFRGLPYYRPVVRSTLLLQKSLHGDVPALFHGVNAALAAAAALVAYALLRRPAFGVGPLPALLGAGLFAVHPIASSCVYPAASGRETLLPALLGLATLYAHLRRGAGWRAAATLLFAGALFGKEASVVLPPLFVLADGLGVSEDPPGRSPRRWLVRYAPLLPVLLLYFGVRRALFAGGEWKAAVLGDPLGPLLSLAYGVQSVFAPFAALAYEPDTPVWWSPLRLAFALAAAGGLAALLLRGRAAARRALAFWSAWFVIAQLPTANLLQQEAPYDERYVFLASLGPIAIAASALSTRPASPRARRWALRAATLVLLAASWTSFQRAATFHDDMVFASQWARTNASSPEARLTLGLARAWAGDLEGAVVIYREALRLQPDFASAHVNLGAALSTLGRTAEAREAFTRALALAPDNPEAHSNLGLLLAADGRLDEALEHYDAALRLDPRFIEAYNNRGTALARKGDLGGARDALEQALRLAPAYTDALQNLALVYERLGRPADAARLRQRAGSTAGGRP